MSWARLWLSFEGRASVRDLWLRFVLPWLFIWLVLAAVLPVDAIVSMMPMEQAMAHPFKVVTPLGYALVVAMNLTALAVGVKRCHDRDRSGWFLFAYFIPVLGQLWLLIELGFMAGTPGRNRFGVDAAR